MSYEQLSGPGLRLSGQRVPGQRASAVLIKVPVTTIRN